MSDNRSARHLLAHSALLMLLAMPLAATASPLQSAVKRGEQLFNHATFDGNGRSCATCHVAGGRSLGRLPNGKHFPSLTNAAAIFPRYKARLHKVVTLEDQVRGCIAGAMHGKPPAYGSEKLNDLVTYITSLAQGKPIAMGGRPE